MTVRAVFGGSFDPPHVGHVMVATWVLVTHPIDELVIIPTWKHAFGKSHGASFTQRIDMCQLAFERFNGVHVSTLERELDDVSRTLDTLQALQQQHPSDALRLVVGADVLTQTDRWYRWDEVAKIAPPIAVGRKGYPLPDRCPIEIPDVSSTDIRKRLGDGEPVSGMVADAVVRYIEHHRLYGTTS